MWRIRRSEIDCLSLTAPTGALLSSTLANQPSWLLQYSSLNFELQNRRELGGDPPVSTAAHSAWLRPLMGLLLV